MENHILNAGNVAAETLLRIREKIPLVLSLTNTVVQPITANLLLAAGAAPAMLCDGSECEDMIKTCTNALLVNLGTLSRPQSEAMLAAVGAANACRVPWVLDPVAVGLLGFRTEFARKILPSKPAVIRGNAAEILALAGYDAKTRGPESTCGSDAAVSAAKELAARAGTVVLVTGKTDYATDGVSVVATANGHEMMTRVTGVGCAMGAFTAACVAVADSPLDAAVASAVLTGVAGEIAFEKSGAPGTFAVKFLDAFYEMTPDVARSRAKPVPVA